MDGRIGSEMLLFTAVPSLIAVDVWYIDDVDFVLIELVVEPCIHSSE